MNVYETKHFNIKTNIDFDNVKKDSYTRPRVKMRKGLSDHLHLNFFLRLKDGSKLLGSVSVNDREALKFHRTYEVSGNVVNLAEDRMKELVHVNDEGGYYFIENYIENELLEELRQANLTVLN